MTISEIAKFFMRGTEISLKDKYVNLMMPLEDIVIPIATVL